jgi:hypothetical protein
VRPDHPEKPRLSRFVEESCTWHESHLQTQVSFSTEQAKQQQGYWRRTITTLTKFCCKRTYSVKLTVSIKLMIADGSDGDEGSK